MKTITIRRIDDEFHARVRAAAKADGRTVTAYVVRAIAAAMQAAGQQDEPSATRGER